jgi:hypothetical protein
VILDPCRGFPIKESARIEFRAEAFNLFNHPQFFGSTTPATAIPAATRLEAAASCIQPAPTAAGRCGSAGSSGSKTTLAPEGRRFFSKRCPFVFSYSHFGTLGVHYAP